VEVVSFLDGANELPGSEDPPWISDERLPWSHANISVRTEGVEVREVGPGFRDPERLHDDQ
jgi:hypothetical protein